MEVMLTLTGNSETEDRQSQYQKHILKNFGNNRISSYNSDGIFFYAFNDTQLLEMRNDVASILDRLSRPYQIINCEGKNYKSILLEGAGPLASRRPINQIDKIFREKFQSGSYTLVLFRLSKMKGSRRPLIARTFLKVLDDSHLDGVRTMSDLVFIDRASFLEIGWQEISPYVRVIPHISTLRQLQDGYGDPAIFEV